MMKGSNTDSVLGLQYVHQYTNRKEIDVPGLSESAADSRNKFEALNHLLPFNSEQDADYKRSSSFFPLRGKKLTAADMDTANYPFMSQQGDEEEKRSQFYPLRGKKIPDELKRGSYFMPMRGRKDDESWSEDEDNVDKRMSSFMPMRGKKKSGFLDTFPHLGKPGTYSTEIMYPSSSGSNRKKRDVAWPAISINKTTDTSPESTGGNETGHSMQKRSVSFMPMRGRREYESFGSQEIKTRLLEKKQFSFMPMRGRRYPFNDSNGSVALELKIDDESTTSSSRSEPMFREADDKNQLQIDNDKRASSFMPMRGRRTSLDDMTSVEYGMAPQEDKRRSHFMPMRGRKNYMGNADISNDHEIYSGDKRASSFMPMRGRRKLIEFTDFNDRETDSDDKRASSFMPMRGRRESLENLNSFNDLVNKRGSLFMPPERGRRESLENLNSFNDLVNKRGSSFMPMRGRRESLENLNNFNDLVDKRRSSFMPMRGRRESIENLNSFNDLVDKRGSLFMPMRGRRSIDDSLVENQTESSRIKRSSSFMPMRGRKMDSSIEDFLEKKSSSFMPMRGRRDLEDNLTQNPEDKRGSSFMPMRGRRGVFDTTYYYNAYPYVISSGIGSSLMTRPYNGDFYPISSVRRYVSKARKFDWDSVKRAFHATRGKRVETGKDSEEAWESEDREQSAPAKSDSGKGCRYKRSIIRPRIPLKPHRQYIALKRTPVFFSPQGEKRFG
ncbi:hypothetical protein HNY73_009482 [Argiope bruennichi]|uniref:Uncharacterized protein n=1 Tax=Argiope bruennichi TaxID=94029 RepID=A0A8T0F9N1_ARGBR|nr:hypothetical protein HNY73_009482 [Argiope bruennichi]